ncbi:MULTISPECIES: chromosomal replication initiator protein DnaA [unclassified Oceanispirochaeta]|uniref:chromosomal replication initiator protein DnaA n=1 Tax=unclassified Oceanispirochaeta TaxID=2635722 RepID=UPI000E0965A9|nr:MULTISPECIES: chromosomal replication initiator protein DnaA [unclassified Oceanispirochaeta]MBF9015234.1 chromosomal replication initiator protein DnaA [Oceanispirochaeta sp. M2]NPD71692.1 chromosomal replication initiator protein DnaA [Oceanispirochaeta sp. M1]RDG32887.1 chromosomal replication initiator protein DnaA [Oceanispirochaeta sp. M1]
MNEFDYSIFWEETIKQLREEKEISDQEYNMYFQSIHYVESTRDKIVLSIPSRFIQSQLKQRYTSAIETRLYEISGIELSLAFEIENRSKEEESSEKPSEKVIEAVPERKYIPHPQLRKDYTFDNFVVGNNNSFAANASKAIAENPGSKYNPCLIYGGVGLGKTHLMQSIGNTIHKEQPDMKIVYIPAETFINDFIESINTKKQTHFKNKYRNADILLIDDIHDLQDKKGTQEELFHTFNALYDANKQMVFTCDRPPSELKNFADRLKNRFVRGLNVDLHPPNYETRYAILRKKLEDRNVVISDDILELISQNINTNIRDLEAALTSIVAYAELVQKEITPEIAKQQLKQFFSSPIQANITIDKIQKQVSEYFNVTLSDLKGKKRTKQITFPRQIAMYIIREITDYSTTEIGLEFGGRDHTTVMHSCQRIEDRIKTDSTIEPTVQELIRSIKET